MWGFLLKKRFFVFLLLFFSADFFNVILQYVESVLETSGEDFESTDDLYEAIGEVLHEMEEDKSEKDIRCKHINLLLVCFDVQKKNQFSLFASQGGV